MRRSTREEDTESGGRLVRCSIGWLPGSS